jgi:hypothetical protein
MPAAAQHRDTPGCFLILPLLFLLVLADAVDCMCTVLDLDPVRLKDLLTTWAVDWGRKNWET